MTKDVRIISRICVGLHKLTVYKVDDVTVDLPNTKCLRTGVAAPSFARVISTDDKSFATTQLTVVKGAGEVELEATVRPAGVPIAWEVERAADDVAGLGKLPFDAPNGASNKRKLTANATGSFHIHAFVDDDRDKKRGPKEGGIIVNLAMVRIAVPAGAANNKVIVNNGVFTDARSDANDLVIDSGTTGGVGPAVNASYGDAEFAKHALAMKMTVVLTGGGPDGRRGVSSVGLGYIQQTPSDSIKATYNDGREVKEILVVNAAAPIRSRRASFPRLRFRFAIPVLRDRRGPPPSSSAVPTPSRPI